MNQEYKQSQGTNTSQKKDSFIQLQASRASDILIAQKTPEGIKLINIKEQEYNEQTHGQTAVDARNILEEELNIEIPGEGPIRVGDLSTKKRRYKALTSSHRRPLRSASSI